jgi:hypothetical protein
LKETSEKLSLKTISKTKNQKYATYLTQALTPFSGFSPEGIHDFHLSGRLLGRQYFYRFVGRICLQVSQFKPRGASVAEEGEGKWDVV